MFYPNSGEAVALRPPHDGKGANNVSEKFVTRILDFDRNSMGIYYADHQKIIRWALEQIEKPEKKLIQLELF